MSWEKCCCSAVQCSAGEEGKEGGRVREREGRREGRNETHGQIDGQGVNRRASAIGEFRHIVSREGSRGQGKEVRVRKRE